MKRRPPTTASGPHFNPALLTPNMYPFMQFCMVFFFDVDNYNDDNRLVVFPNGLLFSYTHIDTKTQQDDTHTHAQLYYLYDIAVRTTRPRQSQQAGWGRGGEPTSQLL